MALGGKFGLALSGGGFRASLFHLGVLACLADLQQLKSVRYLSTVSGGSIVGAAYYLKVKQLLDGTREDGLQPSDAAYGKIVEELIPAFLAGVQTNIRMRTFLNPVKNVRMLQEDYSRSDHISELYSEAFYAPVWASMQRGFERLRSSAGRALDPSFGQSMQRPLVDGGIPLRDLKIFPHGGHPGDVDAYNDDPKNLYKIPVLILNATPLNTGHNWQFTASSVGEPSVRCFPPRGERVDSAPSFPKIRFDDPSHAPLVKKKLESLTLGDAVASSACVPMLFQPMAIHDLYRLCRTERGEEFTIATKTREGEDVIVELVDGGVFDNQGLQALVDKQVPDILCSDASLQLDCECGPSTQAFNVLLRSNDIVMDALREQELGEFVGGRIGHRLSRADLLHWQQNLLPGSPLSQEVLTLLSRIRTDLDSFHDREAYALMYAGYCLCHERVGRAIPQAKPEPWVFEVIVPDLTSRKMAGMLQVSASNIFKVFRLNDVAVWAYAAAIGAPVLSLLGIVVCHFWDRSLKEWIPNPFETVGTLTVALAGVIAYLLASKVREFRKGLKGLQWLRTVRNFFARGMTSAWMLGVPVILMAFVSLAVCVHLAIFDRRYLQIGAMRSHGRSGADASGSRREHAVPM